MFLNLKLIGGLGNQLFQVVFASSQTEEIQLILENPEDKFESFDLYKFKIASGIKKTKIIRFNFVEQKIYNLGIRASSMTAKSLLKRSVRDAASFFIKKSLQTLKPELGVVSISKGVGDIGPRLNPEKPNFLIGYFQNATLVDNFSRDAFNIEISNPKLRSLIELAKVTQPIILQMRLGDYSGDASIGIPILNYYKIGVKRFRDIRPQAEIWLFSDDLELAKERADKAGIENVFVPDVSTLTAAEILTLMSHGSGYVISNSTFGWWAAKLAKNTNAIIVVPHPWFRKLEQPASLIPKDWIKVPAWE